ncbi:9102_t:CDS:2 [Ambispora leptoticha]|uniref:9102_t:CDS:1 n=1 Tax=Ambispora leptoticha TaxID=144679 RepID=A0A9N9G3R4_9GLOM|nr:9102_t:CDS:2 [Ambispora leptoticha]
MEAKGEDFQGEYGTKETEITEKYDKVIKIHGNIRGEFEAFVNATDDKLPSSGIKKILKDKGEVEGKALLEKVSEAIKDPTKFQDKPQTPKISVDQLKEVFGNVDDVVDQGLDPERVGKTIYTHWLEIGDNEGSIKKEMKDKVKDGTSGDEEEKLNMTSYGSTSKDGDPDKPGMVKYL